MKHVSTTQSDMPKAFDPQAVEAGWYARWEADALFVADPTSDKPKFTMCFPPPNITGELHMKLARDVGRRKAHRELRLVAGRVRHKQRVCFPARVPAGLDGLRVERLGHITLGRGHVFHPLDWLGDAGAMVAVSASEPARVRIRALRGS